jgi:hypothetical protein
LAQKPFDSQHQLLGCEGFAEVIVGADLQAVNAIIGSPKRRQHQNRELMASLAKTSENLGAGPVGQHLVEHKKIWINICKKPVKISGCVSGQRQPTTSLELSRQQLTQRRIVIQDPHLGSG